MGEMNGARCGSRPLALGGGPWIGGHHRRGNHRRRHGHDPLHRDLLTPSSWGKFAPSSRDPPTARKATAPPGTGTVSRQEFSVKQQITETTPTTPVLRRVICDRPGAGRGTKVFRVDHVYKTEAGVSGRRRASFWQLSRSGR